MNDHLDAVKATAKTLDFPKLYTAVAVIDKESQDIKIHGHFRSLADLMQRVHLLAAQLTSLIKEEERKFLGVPAARLSQLNQQLTKLRTHVDQVLAIFNAAGSQGGFARIEPSNFHIITGGGQAHDLGGHLRSLDGTIDASFETLQGIIPSVKPKRLADFTRSLDKLREHLQSTANAAAEAQRLVNDTAAASQVVADAQTAASEDAEEMSRQRDEIEKARRTVDEQKDKVTAVSAEVAQLGTSAGTLKTQVEGYQQDFAAFQEALDAREEAINSGKADLQKLVKSLQEQQQVIGNLVVEAEEMLGDTTTAGLSQAFRTEQKALDDKLWWAQIWFYVSVFALLGLVAFATAPGISLPRIAPASGETAGTAALHMLGAATVRFLIILPGLLLIGFVARRHSSLFRLREQYTYKYSVAASVDGFKKQAPSHKEAIAAAAFQELLFNPAADVEIPRRRANPFLVRFLTPAVETVMKAYKDRPSQP